MRGESLERAASSGLSEREGGTLLLAAAAFPMQPARGP